mmetsp:Transcript_6694/g.11491  ORF Transcript_6694/g.11491 Transcript_6694/m.11491 type:complete len:273 (+) Transcript_6694:103-921(+)
MAMAFRACVLFLCYTAGVWAQYYLTPGSDSDEGRGKSRDAKRKAPKHHSDAKALLPRPTSAQCAAAMRHNKSSWLTTYLKDSRCENFWYDSFNCDRNWLTSTVEKQHDFDDAPAILGTEAEIANNCKCSPQALEGCTCADSNIQRLLMNGALTQGRSPWNTCIDSQFVVCAALGQLTNQRDNDIILAPAPKDLNMSSMTGPHDKAYVHQICLLNEVCENKDELFSMSSDKPFACKITREPPEFIVNDRRKKFGFHKWGSHMRHVIVRRERGR